MGGFPLTTKLTGDGANGPDLPSSVEVTWEDRFYPKAWGHPLLRETIAQYYNTHYGSSLVPENIMIFAGGRPGIYTVLAFLKKHVQVRIGNAEWPAYLDIMTQTGTNWQVVPFTKENGFHPPNSAYFEPQRALQQRKAIETHYNFQRKRYGEAFKKLGFTVYTGDGGFYHWMELPEGLTADEFNKRLFKRGAAILKGFDCDMARPHAKDPDYKSPYERMFRFSFGPLLPETFESDIEIMREVFEQYKKDAGVA